LPRAFRGSLPTAWPSVPEARGRRPALVDAAGVVGGGAALALAFPGVEWTGAAWVALAPLVLVAVLRPPRVAFGFGWLGGLVFFVLLLRWINFTIEVYSAIPWPLTWVPATVLAAYCGLWIGLFAGGVAWITRRRSAGWALLAAPFLWVAAEWLRGRLFGGFPWGTLGYTQYQHLPVIQIAELGGVLAVSFVILAVNAALVGAVVLPWRRAVGGLVLAAALVGGSLAFGAVRLAGPEPPPGLTVAIMQPSIEQPLKWDPVHTESTLRIYGGLTRQAAMARPDLIVWPETASPTILRQDPELLAALVHLAGEFDVPLLVGTIDADDATPPGLRNTAFLVTDRGIVGRYDKMHLVPFGEFVPLSGVIGFVKDWAEFIAELEPGTEAVVFGGPPAPFGVVICYEGIFPELVRRFVVGGARLVVNMTNDAWFGRTSGPLQHLGMYPFRAIEHRTAVVRAANTGVSAVIDPSGRITRSLGLFERGVLRAPVPLREVTTLYTRFGDWLAYVALGVSAAALALAATGRGR
jgi:apolipoprotein N-acyltransferase